MMNRINIYRNTHKEQTSVSNYFIDGKCMVYNNMTLTTINQGSYNNKSYNLISQ